MKYARRSVSDADIRKYQAFAQVGCWCDCGSIHAGWTVRWTVQLLGKHMLWGWGLWVVGS